MCLLLFKALKHVSFGDGAKSAEWLLFSLVLGLLCVPKFKMLIENVGDTRFEVPATFSTSGLTGCMDPDLKIDDKGMVVALGVVSLTDPFDTFTSSCFLCVTGNTIAFVFGRESLGLFGIEKDRLFIPVGLDMGDVPGANLTLTAGVTVMADLANPTVCIFVKLSPTEEDLTRKTGSLGLVKGVSVTAVFAVFSSLSLYVIFSSVSHSTVTLEIALSASSVVFLKIEMISFTA